MSEKIGKLIASRLKAKKLKQAWLAEKVGVSVNAVSKWTKTGKIARENVATVAELLDLSADELVTGEEKKTTQKEASFMEIRATTADEMRLLAAYRLATPEIRAGFDGTVNFILDSEQSGARKA